MQKLLHLRRQISAYQVSSLKVVWMCTYNQRLIHYVTAFLVSLEASCSATVGSAVTQYQSL